MTNNDLLSFGLMNSMKSDNILLNMMLVILIPIIMRFMNDMLLNNISLNINAEYIYGWKYERYFKYTFKSNRHCDTLDEPPSSKAKNQTFNIQKMIMMYISKFHAKRIEKSESEYCSIELFDNDDIGYYNKNKNRNKTHTEILTNVSEKYWFNITDTLKFKWSKNKIPVSDYIEPETEIVYYFKSKLSIKDIDDFIEKVECWYKAYVNEQNSDTSRYSFNMKSREYNTVDMNSISKSLDIPMQFYKNKLTDEKDFSNIFIPNKDKLIKYIDDFENSKGKFSIVGFPKQLSILLYGVPGTGKTSLIKAISKMIKRNIVNIDLSRVTTISDFDKIMYDCTFRINGQDINYDYDKIIYVIEDIDRMESSVVLNNQDDNLTDNEYDNEHQQSSSISDITNIVDNLINTKLVDNKIRSRDNIKKNKLINNNDKLTLAYLLQVFDGVVESPDRMIIITTNHPDKLDKTLMRPGRINMKLKLDYIKFKEAREMISHFVPNDIFTNDQLELLKSIINKNNISPAIIQQYCVEYDTLDDILHNFYNKYSK